MVCVCVWVMCMHTCVLVHRQRARERWGKYLCWVPVKHTEWLWARKAWSVVARDVQHSFAITFDARPVLSASALTLFPCIGLFLMISWINMSLLVRLLFLSITGFLFSFFFFLILSNLVLGLCYHYVVRFYVVRVHASEWSHMLMLLISAGVRSFVQSIGEYWL